MKRVSHPTCHCCGAKSPDYQSEWIGVRVCYACLLQIATWMNDSGVLKPGLIQEELFDGVFSGGTIPTRDQYTVIVRSHLGFSTFAYKVIDRV